MLWGAACCSFAALPGHLPVWAAAIGIFLFAVQTMLPNNLSLKCHYYMSESQKVFPMLDARQTRKARISTLTPSTFILILTYLYKVLYNIHFVEQETNHYKPCIVTQLLNH